MSAPLRRRIAIAALDLLQTGLPPHLTSWGQAIRQEVAMIADDTDACLFALDGLRGLAPSILAFHLLRPFTAIAAVFGHHRGKSDMQLVRHPQFAGIACAVGASLSGLGYLALAGAPLRYLTVNAGALAVGLTAVAIAARMPRPVQPLPGIFTLLASLLLLATGLLGTAPEGAARWLKLGGLFVQPSLILLPAMIVAFARSRTMLSLAGMIIAAGALAIQPDRGMAGMLAASLAWLVVARPDPMRVVAFAAAIASFGVTLVLADTLPASPFVDRVLYSSFAVHPLAGAAVLGGSLLLVVPAVVGALQDRVAGHAYVAFGIIWFAAIIAAALGNYPTPVVGYGGSAILGYVLSVAALPGTTRAPGSLRVGTRDPGHGNRDTNAHLSKAAALAS